MTSDPVFELFGAAHLAAFAVTVTLAVCLPLLVGRAGGERALAAFGRALAVFIVLHQIVKASCRVLVYGYPLVDNLQLNICDVSVLLSAVLLTTRHQRAFELVYFWGLAGTLQAILTPDLDRGFPHPVFWFYFISHGMILVTIGYGVLGFRLRPTLQSLWRVFAITQVYALVAGLVNLALGTNYLYLCRKPAGASAMDFLGPWPWYILVLEVLALASFFLYYAPFGIAAWLRRRRERKVGAARTRAEAEPPATISRR